MSGLTQAEVAERADLAVEVYGRLERGEMMPSMTTFIRLAAVLRVRPGDLLDGSVIANGPEPEDPDDHPRAIRRVIRMMGELAPEDQERICGIVAAAMRMQRMPPKRPA